MHAPFDRSRKSDDDTKPRSGVGFLILPVLMAIVLIALTIFHPKASLWISQAVQAEFGGSGIADGVPVQTVQEPSMTIAMRTVNAH
jgi:hypothetical protein